jgi:gliding motility-associated-like protein
VEGPDINCIPTPENGSNSDGSITVISSGVNLTYQLEGGSPQLGNVFSGLSANTYYVIVTDEYGCSTRDTVVVESLHGTLLVALAEKDRKCLYKPANSDIRITRVTGMKDLKATLYYNDNILNCTNFNANSAEFPGITAHLFTTPPRVELAWHGTSAITSTDTLLLGSMIFETLHEGAADVTWEANSTITYFLNESGDSIYPVFFPGDIIIHEIPEIAIDQSQYVCEQDSITLIPQIIGGKEPIEYIWQTPNGISQSQELPVLNAKLTDAGNYQFTVSDYFYCADTVKVNLTVVPLPSANFPATNPSQDTIPFEQTYLLEATPGYASYEWNTGDMIYYINVTEEGEYTVTMKTEKGCKAVESVYMLETFVPIQVPSAFTPNGDGLNDTFKPVVNTELARQFSMCIYNKWGQLIFETRNASKGWNGENAMPGVYNWVISYENRVGKVSQMKGSVALVK